MYEYEYEYEQILVLGHVYGGWSFITFVFEGRLTIFKRGLKIFKLTLQFTLAFQKWTAINFTLWKWLPHNSEETTNIEATNHTEVHHEYSHIYKINVD